MILSIMVLVMEGRAPSLQCIATLSIKPHGCGNVKWRRFYMSGGVAVGAWWKEGGGGSGLCSSSGLCLLLNLLSRVTDDTARSRSTRKCRA